MTAEERREVIEAAATEVFAERGYHAAGMGEIARRSGVTVPVLYDHFPSKHELHRRLLERHFAELREIWARHLALDAAPARRLEAAVDAWFAYVETHPYASRMLFRPTSGDPEAEAIHREVAGRSRAALLPLLAQQPGLASAAVDPASLEMLWEIFRAALQGLAIWWYDRREVPREQVVAAALNGLWVGFERLLKGETWDGAAPYA